MATSSFYLSICVYIRPVVSPFLLPFTRQNHLHWCVAENLRYDQFCEKIRDLFGSDIKNQDLKSVYRKISTNPDAKVDWSEVRSYIQQTTHSPIHPFTNPSSSFVHLRKREGERERQRETERQRQRRRHTHRDRQRQRGTERDRETHTARQRQTDRDKERQRQRDRETETER